MVKNNIDKNQAKLGIRTHDFNVPEEHFTRFVVEFIEECYPILGIKENKKAKKKGGRPAYHPCSMLKLIIYAKIDHIESARVIAEMAKYHDIYKFVSTGLIHQNAQYKGFVMNIILIMKYCSK